MDGAGDEFLARARLAEDEHRGVRTARGLGDEVHDLLDAVAFRDEEGELVLQGAFLEEPHLLPEPDGFQCVADGDQEAAHDDGLDHVVVGAELHGGDHGVAVFVGRDHDHEHLGVHLPDGAQGLDAVHARQAHVQEDEVGGFGFDGAQAVLGGLEGPEVVVGLQGEADAFPDGRLVVDEHEGELHRLFAPPF